MMLFHKRLLSVLLTVFGAVALQAQELNLRDEFGRTELMNYVMWQEFVIAVIQIDVNHLWDVCYESVTESDCRRTAESNYKRYAQGGTSRTVVKRRESCMDSDILALKNREQDLAQYIQNTLSGINDLVAAGAQLDACDNSGKTVLNYCHTYKIYEVLLAHGVPFQYVVYAYFNPQTIAASSFGLVVLAVYLYQNGYLPSLNLSLSAVNSSLQSTDNKDIVSSVVDAVIVPAIEEVTQGATVQDAFDIIESMGLSC